MADTVDTTADPLAPEEAIVYFRQKVPVPIDVWDGLVSKNHDWAFKLAGIADMDVMDDVFTALQDSIEKGEDFRDFKARVSEQLENAWGGTVAEPGARIETIFRTNLQSSYMAGQYAQAQESKEDRPYALFDFIGDQDLCEDCNAIADEIGHFAIPLDEWTGEVPPIHHNCRCGWTTLTEEEAREQGVLENMPDVSEYISEDFDHIPGQEPLPDPDEYDSAIADYVRTFTDE